MRDLELNEELYCIVPKTSLSCRKCGHIRYGDIIKVCYIHPSVYEFLIDGVNRMIFTNNDEYLKMFRTEFVNKSEFRKNKIKKYLENGK